MNDFKKRVCKPEVHIVFDKRSVYIVSGYLLCILAIIGIFVPILPTTPFLLAAALLFAESSPEMYKKLCSNEYLGSFIKNYREHCGVPRETIRKALLFLWMTLTVGIFLSYSAWLKLLLFAIGTGVSIHLMMLKKSSRRPLRFTLLELLISIGIISVIFSMLIPVISRVRNMSAKTVCMNNLKQIGIALQLYSLDNADIIPPLIYGLNGSCMVVKMNNVPVGLGYLIGSYGTFSENYGCPLNPNNLPQNVAINWRTKPNAQNAYFYRFDDCGFNLKLSHPDNSKRAFLIDFCCVMGNKMISAHDFEDVNSAYVDGSVRRHKNSPVPNELFTVSAVMKNGQMQTAGTNAWQNADR